MKTLYLDIFSGISGDMFIGALLDLGVDFEQLEKELKKLPLDGYHLHAARKRKANIEGTKFDVHLSHQHPHEHAPGHTHEHEHEHSHHPDHDDEDLHHHQEDEHPYRPDHPPAAESHAHAHDSDSHADARDFAAIKKLISASALSSWVKDKAIAVFHRIAVAEGKIHGRPAEQVHFHEVGAVDSIVDIVGACISLELLGKPQVLSAPVVEGSGWVECAHGRFPVPTTATLEILGARGVPVTQCPEPHELVTPTGAALLAEFAKSFETMHQLVAHKIGYGLGTRDLASRPNVLRAVLSQSSSGSAAPTYDWETDTIAVLETNLDDSNPEILGYFMEQALAAGALDVFYCPVHMKKNRPGAVLTVLCSSPQADQFAELILRETSAFGVRRTLAERRKLRRQMMEVTTPFGAVQVKVGRLQGRIIQVSPEFESCKRLAAEHQVALKEIYDAARQAAID